MQEYRQEAEGFQRGAEMRIFHLQDILYDEGCHKLQENSLPKKKLRCRKTPYESDIPQVIASTTTADTNYGPVRRTR